MPNAGYERIETLFVSINPAKYRLENINKTVDLIASDRDTAQRESRSLGMNGIDTINLLSPHCSCCQRYRKH
jgi:hypothetical protein